MDFAFDYNSLSERFYKLRSELNETVGSLDKLNSYQNFVPSECKKLFSMPVEKNASSEESSAEQSELSDSSESEESSSDNDHPAKKVALQSTVTTKVESSKTRKKFICMYNSDNKNQLRNRRFLGMVQNTLQKFRDEEVKREPKELIRKKAIEKVEAAVEDDKNSVKRQKCELLSKSRNQQMELECLGKMMRIAESFELWKNNQEYLLNFIGTETKPRIFFLPTSHSSTTREQLQKSRMKIIEETKKQKAYVEEILSRIKQSYGLSTSTVNVEETLQKTEIDSSQCVLKPEITDEETKDMEEVLHLDLSESECEDIY